MNELIMLETFLKRNHLHASVNKLNRKAFLSYELE